MVMSQSVESPLPQRINAREYSHAGNIAFASGQSQRETETIVNLLPTLHHVGGSAHFDRVATIPSMMSMSGLFSPALVGTK